MLMSVGGSLQAQYVFDFFKFSSLALFASIENSVKIKSCARNDINMNERSNIIRKNYDSKSAYVVYLLCTLCMYYHGSPT